MKQSPEWFITDSMGEKPRIVDFPDIFAIKSDVKSLMILWPLSSYYVNVKEKYFIIQGGKRIQPTGIDEMKDVKLLYARRNRQDMTLDGQNKVLHVSYLMGVEGQLDGKTRVLYLEVSEDGRLWRWKFER